MDTFNLSFKSLWKVGAVGAAIAFVWAIGTGDPETPESALETIKFIKTILNSKFHILNLKVLYGGSVNSKNLADYLKFKEINGVLVGSASLNKDEVRKMAALLK